MKRPPAAERPTYEDGFDEYQLASLTTPAFRVAIADQTPEDRAEVLNGLKAIHYDTSAAQGTTDHMSQRHHVRLITDSTRTLLQTLGLPSNDPSVYQLTAHPRQWDDSFATTGYRRTFVGVQSTLESFFGNPSTIIDEAGNILPKQDIQPSRARRLGNMVVRAGNHAFDKHEALGDKIGALIMRIADRFDRWNHRP